MSTYTYNLPATPEQLQAIGMVATEWQRLESIIDGGIWSLAGVYAEWVRGDRGSPMTFAVQARGKLKAAKVAMPATKIRAAAELIAQAADDLERFLQQHGVLHAP
jgi:hypothetical protein